MVASELGFTGNHNYQLISFLKFKITGI